MQIYISLPFSPPPTWLSVHLSLPLTQYNLPRITGISTPRLVPDTSLEAAVFGRNMCLIFFYLFYQINYIKTWILAFTLFLSHLFF